MEKITRRTFIKQLTTIAAGIGAEKHYHSHIRDFFEDNIPYQLQFLTFIFRQM